MSLITANVKHRGGAALLQISGVVASNPGKLFILSRPQNKLKLILYYYMKYRQQLDYIPI